MALQEIGVVLYELRCGLVSAFAGKARGAQQGGNFDGDRRRRVPGSLFPSLLGRSGPMQNEISSRSHHHGVWIESRKRAVLVHPPCQNDRVGDFIELNAPPVRLTV